MTKCRVCSKKMSEEPKQFTRWEMCEKCVEDCREVADRYGIPPGDLNIPELF